MFNNGGMRNLGANGNQPLITNQNDFQFFDNVTRVVGKHTMKAGGSFTLRSREILNADTIVGRFDFNQNLTSNCAGITSGCTPLANTGFDVASFLLGYASNASRTLFDPGTYTELRPEFAAYMQDDIRADEPPDGQRRPAVGHVRALGREGQQAVQLRRVDRPVRRRIRQRDDQRRPGRPLSADLFEDRLRAAARLRIRRDRQRQNDRARRLRAVLELHARRHLVVEGAEPAVPPGAGDDTNFGTNIVLSNGLAAPPGVNLTAAPGGSTRSAFLTSTSATRTRTTSTSTCSGRSATNYMVEAAYSGSRTENAALKTDLNQAPPTVGVTDQNVNRPYANVAPALRTVGALSSTGYVEYNGLLMKFQRRSANHISFLNSYTYGRAIDLNSDNDGTVTLTNIFDPEYNRGPADYDVTPHLQLELDLRAAVGARDACGAGGRSAAFCICGRASQCKSRSRRRCCRPASPTTGRIRSAIRRCRNPTADMWFNTACFQQVADPTGTFGNTGRNSVRGPGRKNVDMSLIKNTKIGAVSSELRLEVFNLFNHRAVQQPQRSVGQRRFRHDLIDRGEPVVRDVRHDGTSDSAGGQIEVLSRHEGTKTRRRFFRKLIFVLSCLRGVRRC